MRNIGHTRLAHRGPLHSSVRVPSRARLVRTQSFPPTEALTSSTGYTRVARVALSRAQSSTTYNAQWSAPAVRAMIRVSGPMIALLIVGSGWTWSPRHRAVAELGPLNGRAGSERRRCPQPARPRVPCRFRRTRPRRTKCPWDSGRSREQSMRWRLRSASEAAIAPQRDSAAHRAEM